MRSSKQLPVLGDVTLQTVSNVSLNLEASVKSLVDRVAAGTASLNDPEVDNLLHQLTVQNRTNWEVYILRL